MEKCNHLVPREEQNKKCNPSDPESRIHYWIPTGRVETIFNGLISADFCCKYCNKRATNFFSKDEYNLNKRFIEV
jgi:hypothetical protein